MIKILASQCVTGSSVSDLYLNSGEGQLASQNQVKIVLHSHLLPLLSNQERLTQVPGLFWGYYILLTISTQV